MWVDTGVLLAEPELELEDPLDPVVSGAAAAGEATLPLEPVVIGAVAAEGAVAGAGAADAGLAPADGLPLAFTGW